MSRTSRKQLSESVREKLELYEKMENGTASAHDLVKMSLFAGMISKEEYQDFLEIEREYGGG